MSLCMQIEANSSNCLVCNKHLRFKEKIMILKLFLNPFCIIKINKYSVDYIISFHFTFFSIVTLASGNHVFSTSSAIEDLTSTTH